MNELEVKNAGSLTVFDAENQSWKEITQKEQIIASKLHNKLIEGAYFSAVIITKMIDERHYLALGCESRDEYINTMTPYSRRQAYVLLSIGRKFAGFLGGNTQDNLLLSENNSESAESALKDNMSESAESALSRLGITKLYELTKLDDSEIDELMNTGKANINNNQITIEELQESSAKEVTKRIAEVKKQYTGKISQLSEEVKQLKEEKKLLQKDTEKINTALELEKKYGAPASKLEDKQERVQESIKLLNDFAETLVRSGVTDEDPQVLQQSLVDLIRQVDGVYNRLADIFGNVIANAG